MTQRHLLPGFALHSQRPAVKADATVEQIVRKASEPLQLGRRDLLDVGAEPRQRDAADWSYARLDELGRSIGCPIWLTR